MTASTPHAEPQNPALPPSGFVRDGYLAALVKYRFLASAVWMTADALEHIERPENT